MKLRNKLKISFCIMVILPVIMCSIFAYAFFKYQATTIHQLYEVDSGELLLFSGCSYGKDDRKYIQ